MSDLLVIANGLFARGFAGARWRRVCRRLRETFGSDFEIYYTSGPGDAVQRMRAALRDGCSWVAAAGGDGIFNEVVNGFFDSGIPIRTGASLSFLPCGSGNDWIRTLDVAHARLDSVDALVHAEIRLIDVGLAQFRNLRGSSEQRMFINVAEAGVGGSFLSRRHRRTPLLNRRFSYRLEAIVEALRFPPVVLRLAFDDSNQVSTGRLLSLIVANGRYFGGGMHCAPMARPDDGLLEIITLGDFHAAEVLLKIRKFISGAYLDDPKVRHRSAVVVEAVSDETVFLEMDGELVGTLPARFEILPRALPIRA